MKRARVIRAYGNNRVGDILTLYGGEFQILSLRGFVELAEELGVEAAAVAPAVERAVRPRARKRVRR